MEKMMLIVVSYDIVSDKRRRRVYKLLEGYGERQQFSVFECDISDKKLTGLRNKLASLIDPDEDSVRIYRLCASCRAAADILGTGEHLIEPLVIII
jgi:CRISPR-associated protein Cas2